jgi:hypothetical protein
MTNRGRPQIKSISRGRPKTKPISRCRSLLWYWAVRGKSGLSDGILDVIYAYNHNDNSKVYASRNRVFEDIRKHGRAISDGESKAQRYSLLDRVNSNDLTGSKEIYVSMLWDVLAEKKTSLKQTRTNLSAIIKECNLGDLPFEKQYKLKKTDYKAASILYGIPEEEIHSLFNDKVKMPGKEEYEDALSAFDMASKYDEFANQVNFELILKLLNFLCFFILLYRYSIATRNHQLLITASEKLEVHLSFFLNPKIKWLNKKISNDTFHAIFNNIQNSDDQDQEDLPIRHFKKKSAVFQLFTLMNKKEYLS